MQEVCKIPKLKPKTHDNFPEANRIDLPFGPEMAARPLRKVIEVDVQVIDGIRVSHVQSGADEVEVGGRVVQGLQVLPDVVRVGPVGVLEEDGVEGGLRDERRILGVVVEEALEEDFEQASN